jgi:hypothetical protein
MAAGGEELSALQGATPCVSPGARWLPTQRLAFSARPLHA